MSHGIEQLEVGGGGEEDVGSYLKYLYFYSPKFLLAECYQGA